MYLFGWLGYFKAYFTIKWRNSVVLALSLCTTERCKGTGHKACLYTPLRCLYWQMSKEVCGWYDELQVIYNMQWANCSCDDEMEQRWQKEQRLQIASELRLAELTVQLNNWLDPTRRWTSGSWAGRLHRIALNGYETRTMSAFSKQVVFVWLNRTVYLCSSVCSTSFHSMFITNQKTQILFRPVCTQSVIIIIMEKFNVLLYILIYVSNADALPLHCSLRKASGYLQWNPCLSSSWPALCLIHDLSFLWTRHKTVLS